MLRHHSAIQWGAGAALGGATCKGLRREPVARLRLRAAAEAVVATWLCLKLDVGAERRNDDGAAIAVVTGIDDMLHTGCEVYTAPHVRRVVGLKNIFAAIIQLAIAQQESQAARREIVLVIFLDGVGHERDAGAILLAMPPCALGSHALRKGLVYLRVGERLGLTVVPSEAAEGGEILSETLLEVDAEAALAREVPGVGGDVG